MKKIVFTAIALLGVLKVPGHCGTPVNVIPPSAISLSSVTAAANTAVTVTVTTSTEGGSGAYSSGYLTYVTHIYAVAYATGTLPTASTPLSCTTTNLQSLSLKFPTVITTGTTSVIDLGFEGNPIHSTSSGTTAISCPASGGVLWSLQLNYYQAP